MHPVLRHAIIQRKCSRRQQGAVTLLVVISLPLMLLAMGWALDFGHVFVNKTRLQNALDATALSAAIAINGDVTHSTAAATIKGQATFNLFKAALGNNELSNLSASSLVFSYSKTLYPWGTFNSTKDTFAFVKVTSTNMLNVTPVLIKVFKVFNKNITVPALATAGPVGQNCTIMPFLLCATKNAPCNEDSCYGYTEKHDYSLYNNYAAGNFGLLNLSNNGANGIRDELKSQAATNCSTKISSETGVAWGPVRDGINYRIDTLDTDHNDYNSSGNENKYEYSDYKSNGGNGGRVMAVPIGDCSVMEGDKEDNEGRNKMIPLVGYGCVFITEHVPQGNNQAVTVEYIGSCQQAGGWSPQNSTLNGPYKIVLFKSTSSPDS